MKQSQIWRNVSVTTVNDGWWWNWADVGRSCCTTCILTYSRDDRLSSAPYYDDVAPWSLAAFLLVSVSAAYDQRTCSSFWLLPWSRVLCRQAAIPSQLRLKPARTPVRLTLHRSRFSPMSDHSFKYLSIYTCVSSSEPHSPRHRSDSLLLSIRPRRQAL